MHIHSLKTISQKTFFCFSTTVNIKKNKGKQVYASLQKDLLFHTTSCNKSCIYEDIQNKIYPYIEASIDSISYTVEDTHTECSIVNLSTPQNTSIIR